jgi:hypothetical protein
MLTFSAPLDDHDLLTLIDTTYHSTTIAHFYASIGPAVSRFWNDGYARAFQSAMNVDREDAFSSPR